MPVATNHYHASTLRCPTLRREKRVGILGVTSADASVERAISDGRLEPIS
jgi:hypothetical protein